MDLKETFRAGYHNLLRPEILELIPKSAKSMLDLGCGAGALGAALKKRQECWVDGIEINKEASAAAIPLLDRVYVDNLNRFDPSFLNKKYDCIIAADILEHLVYPWSVLKKFSYSLSDDGIVVASIPNVSHPYIIAQLERGLFRYEQAGLLDFSHLRFFTPTTMFQLFCKAGLKIFNIIPYPSAENPIQYLIQACKPILQAEYPCATIVMLTYNGWEMTERSLLSLQENTNLPYKLVIVDNGSSDSTIYNLRKDPTVFHIENKRNLGFAAGCNIGLELVDTPYFVLVNNDVLFTEGWLEKLVHGVEKDKDYLAAGPVSNCVSGPQQLLFAKYNTTEEMEKFAAARPKDVAHPVTQLNRLAFFCVLFKTEALEKVGFLNEIFFPGNFEDDDYCLRLQRAGYKLGMVNDCFIHHWGSQTFKLNSIDHKAAMETNRKAFFGLHYDELIAISKNKNR